MSGLLTVRYAPHEVTAPTIRRSPRSVVPPRRTPAPEAVESDHDHPEHAHEHTDEPARDEPLLPEAPGEEQHHQRTRGIDQGHVRGRRQLRPVQEERLVDRGRKAAAARSSRPPSSRSHPGETPSAVARRPARGRAPPPRTGSAARARRQLPDRELRRRGRARPDQDHQGQVQISPGIHPPTLRRTVPHHDRPPSRNDWQPDHPVPLHPTRRRQGARFATRGADPGPLPVPDTL